MITVGAMRLDRWNSWSPKIKWYPKNTGVLLGFLRDVRSCLLVHFETW